MRNQVTYRVYKNGKFTGIIETNFEWASVYWKHRCNDNAKYELVPQ